MQYRANAAIALCNRSRLASCVTRFVERVEARMHCRAHLSARNSLSQERPASDHGAPTRREFDDGVARPPRLRFVDSAYSYRGATSAARFHEACPRLRRFSFADGLR